MNPRDLFLPKRPELKTQCPSCPFRDGNDKEFGEICQKLKNDAAGKGTIVIDSIGISKKEMRHARTMIRMEASNQGDFICHQTAYNSDMSLKPASEHRQCPGATKWFKSHGPKGHP